MEQKTASKKSWRLSRDANMAFMTSPGRNPMPSTIYPGLTCPLNWEFISDIAGSDIEEHNSNRGIASRKVRSWLRTTSLRSNIPGPRKIWGRFNQFNEQLPAMCDDLGIDIEEIPFDEYSDLISVWLKANALPVFQITAWPKAIRR